MRLLGGGDVRITRSGSAPRSVLASLGLPRASVRESRGCGIVDPIGIVGAVKARGPRRTPRNAPDVPDGLAVELIERCLAQVDRFMSLGVSVGQFTENATKAHLDIVDAIASRDSAGARTRMEEHLECGSRLMKDALLRGQLVGVGIS